MPKLKYFAKWASLCLCLGVAGGIIGACFSHLITLVTTTRGNNPWLLYLLPLIGPILVLIYKALKVEGASTNDVLKSAENKSPLSVFLAPAIFFATALSHLFGASVGREGAALQIGGSVASVFKKPFKLNDKDNKILIRCGMAGLFSAVFGTPLAAAVFALEIVCVGGIHFASILPTFLTSIISYIIALMLKIHPERFSLSKIPDFGATAILKTLLIILAGVLVGIAFCYTLKYSKILFKKLFKNPYLRIFVGGCIALIITLLLNSSDYLGAGVNIIEEIFEGGEIVPYAFIIKLLLTALCIGAGFKGGEIVPSLFIGATLGGTLAILLGLSAPFGAAVGMITLFCSVTNCPLASLLLGLEMFSGKGAIFITVACAISFILSEKISLYSAQEIKGIKERFSLC